MNELQLTPFQVSILAALVEARQKAQTEEAEFVRMCLKNGDKLPSGGVPIRLEQGKLLWQEPENVKIINDGSPTS